MSEWRHTCGAPVVARPHHQVVTLHASRERAARQTILKPRRAVGAAEARDDAYVRIQVLNKLSFEPVVTLAFGYEVNPRSVNGGRGIAIELIGAVVSSPARKSTRLGARERFWSSGNLPAEISGNGNGQLDKQY